MQQPQQRITRIRIGHPEQRGMSVIHTNLHSTPSPHSSPIFVSHRIPLLLTLALFVILSAVYTVAASSSFSNHVTGYQTSSTQGDHRQFFPSLHSATYDSIQLHSTSGAREMSEKSLRNLRRPSHDYMGRTLLQEKQTTDSTTAVFASSSLTPFSQTFPHLTFLLRTKAPFTTRHYETLNTYLFPYKLGAYMPHHSYLFTIGYSSSSSSGTDAEVAADAQGTFFTATGRGGEIHDDFAHTHSSHASHPSIHHYLSHPTMSQSMDDIIRWLSSAPSVVEVSVWKGSYSLHPKLTSQSDRIHVRNLRRRRMLQETSDGVQPQGHPTGRVSMHVQHLSQAHQQRYAEEDSSSELDWSFNDFDRPTPASSSWRKLTHAPAASSSSSPSTGSHTSQSFAASAAAPLLSTPRPFHIVHLRAHLFANPLLKHSAKDLVMAQAAAAATAGENDDASSTAHSTSQYFSAAFAAMAGMTSSNSLQSHMRNYEESMQHVEKTLQVWKQQLESLDLSTAGIEPLDEYEQTWLQNARTLTNELNHFQVHVSRYSSQAAEQSFLAQVYDKLSSPLHIYLTLITPELIGVYCSSWFLPFVTSHFLATKNEIQWQEPFTLPVLHNKFIRNIIQSDRGVNQTSIWNHGIRGQGQSIQLGDTGLDADNCFFSDVNNPIPVNFFNFRHRKVVTYQLFENADVGDDENGHGTHVGGSLVGSMVDTTNPLAEFGGMAPLAKVAFFDLKRSGSDDLLVPASIYTPYLGKAYNNGVRVSSNSWGSPDGEYGSYCIELDQFVHDFPDMLIVFAAGNYGEQGWNSISSPGVSKNVLTVGSSKTSPASFYDAGVDVGIEITMPEQMKGKFQIAEANFGADFNKIHIDETSRIVVANPPDACSPLLNTAAELTGSVVLVRRGTCHFYEKAQALQTASANSAVLMLVINNEEGPPAHMASDPSTPADAFNSLSLVMIGKTLGESMLAYTIACAQDPSLQPLRINAPVQVDPPDENESIVSSFSSRGPTFGGRLKPDLLAPGEFVRSVRSDGNIKSNNCPTSLEQGLLQLEGTSMSTPIVAAAAAMVRQYLMEGFYPYGRSLSDRFGRKLNVITPAASTVKAMLIHSAISATGDVLTKRSTDLIASSIKVKGAPSNFQGYGRLLLDHVLRFDDTIPMPFGMGPNYFPFHTSPLVKSSGLPNLQIFDSPAPINSDEVHSYCYMLYPPPPFSIAGKNPSLDPLDSDDGGNATSTARQTLPYFRATLVWTDPPIAKGASFVLMNNLDLFVTSPRQRQTWLGNDIHFDDDMGEHPQWDLENNVEQVSFHFVELNTPPTSRRFPIPILVHVRGTNVVTGQPQPYSLVVSGWFTDREGALKNVGLSNCMVRPTNRHQVKNINHDHHPGRGHKHREYDPQPVDANDADWDPFPYSPSPVMEDAWRFGVPVDHHSNIPSPRDFHREPSSSPTTRQHENRDREPAVPAGPPPPPVPSQPSLPTGPLGPSFDPDDNFSSGRHRSASSSSSTGAARPSSTGHAPSPSPLPSSTGAAAPSSAGPRGQPSSTGGRAAASSSTAAGGAIAGSTGGAVAGSTGGAVASSTGGAAAAGSTGSSYASASSSSGGFGSGSGGPPLPGPTPNYIDVLCPNDCNTIGNQGTCNSRDGLCTCIGDWTGADCSIRAVPLLISVAPFVNTTDGSVASPNPFTWTVPNITVPADGWSYVSLNLFTPDVIGRVPTVAEVLTTLDSMDSILVTMTRLFQRGDPDLYIAFDAFPSLRKHDLSNTQCDSCSSSDTTSSSSNRPANGNPSIITITAAVIKQHILDATNRTFVPADTTSSGGTSTAPLTAFTPGAAATVYSSNTEAEDDMIANSKLGIIRMGIHAYCCDDSSVTLAISPVYPPTGTNRARLAIFIAIICASVVIIVIVAVLLWKRRLRNLETPTTRSTDEGIDLMPIPPSPRSTGSDGHTAQMTTASQLPQRTTVARLPKSGSASQLISSASDGTGSVRPASPSIGSVAARNLTRLNFSVLLRGNSREASVSSGTNSNTNSVSITDEGVAFRESSLSRGPEGADGSLHSPRSSLSYSGGLPSVDEHSTSYRDDRSPRSMSEGGIDEHEYVQSKNFMPLSGDEPPMPHSAV